MYILPAAITFCVTVLAMLALRPVAKGIDLVDKPGGRKTHDGHIPLIGGLAMFIGIAAGFGFFYQAIATDLPLIGVAAILVAMGLLDDRFGLASWVRLTVHFVVALALISGTGELVTQLGNPFGMGEVTLHGVWAMAFTVLLIGVAINAFNMLDGMDGLAGSTAVIVIAALAVVEHLTGGASREIAICMVAAAAVCGFLVFNLPASYVGKMRCFMGDAGSTMIGVVIAWLGIRTSQFAATGDVHPVTVLWIAGLPMFEFFWTIFRRLLRGHSPLNADREHFHHLLTDAGFSTGAALIVLVLASTVFAGTGIALSEVGAPDPLSLGLLMLAGAALVRLMYRAAWLVQFVPAGWRTAKHMPAEAPHRLGA